MGQNDIEKCSKCVKKAQSGLKITQISPKEVQNILKKAQIASQKLKMGQLWPKMTQNDPK